MKKEPLEIPDKYLKCSICGEILEDKLISLPNIIILTKEMETPILLDMKQALQIISDYCYKKYYHLSSSQVLLLRPDVAGRAFRQIFKGMLFFGFEYSNYCKSCYNKHKQKFPLK